MCAPPAPPNTRRAVPHITQCPDMNQSQDVLLDADGRLVTDLACIRCGYNLRGLKATGVCAECGNPVSDSATPVPPRPIRITDWFSVLLTLLGYCLFGISFTMDRLGFRSDDSLIGWILLLEVVGFILALYTLDEFLRKARREQFAVALSLLMSSFVIILFLLG